MNCVQCQASLVPGALWCGGCGMPVMAVPGPPAAAAVAAPAAPCGVAVRELVVVEGRGAGTRVPLPAEGEAMLLGRHDLMRAPPWVVDVDLARLMQLTDGEGAPVSRDQATLTRRAGELLITPRGQAPTLHRSQGAPDYQPLANAQAHPVRPGDRLVFGHAHRALVLQALG